MKASASCPSPPGQRWPGLSVAAGLTGRWPSTDSKATFHGGDSALRSLPKIPEPSKDVQKIGLQGSLLAPMP